jgi:hypothetical protein
MNEHLDFVCFQGFGALLGQSPVLETPAGECNDLSAHFAGHR